MFEFLGWLLLCSSCVVAVWLGARYSKLEGVDIWRSAWVALFALPAMIALRLVLFPLHFVWPLHWLLTAVVVFCGYAVAAKFVLACPWRSTTSIGLCVLAANLLFGHLFRVW
jgi:hypothetical protein